MGPPPITQPGAGQNWALERGRDPFPLSEYEQNFSCLVHPGKIFLKEPPPPPPSFFIVCFAGR